jgi:DNA-binding IclR family transcriptional regulator
MTAIAVERSKRTEASGGADGRRTGPRSVSRTLDILQALTSSEGGRSLAELAAMLKLPKSSMLNLLKSLEETNYVVRKDNRYDLGSQAFALAMDISRRAIYPWVLAPLLEKVAKQAGETALIAALTEHGAYVSFLEVREGDRALRLHAKRGEVEPLNSVVVGQVILAFLPEARRKALLDACAFPKTPYSLSRAQLEARLRSIAKEGYAVGMGGRFEDTIGVAAPVFDQTGEVRCAVAVGGPIDRIKAQEAHVRDCVVSAAREMSKLLGYR